MEMKYCQSCVIPLTPETSGVSSEYCNNCTDLTGNLKSKEMIKEGLAQFLMMVDPCISHSVAEKRAEHYMNAMPAWAEE